MHFKGQSEALQPTEVFQRTIKGAVCKGLFMDYETLMGYYEDFVFIGNSKSNKALSIAANQHKHRAKDLLVTVTVTDQVIEKKYGIRVQDFLAIAQEIIED